MSPLSPKIRRLARIARTAFLAGCLSLLTVQQFGHGTREILDSLLFRTGLPAAHAIGTDEGGAAGPAFSRDSLAPTCEAVLTERKSLVVCSTDKPKPTVPRPLGVFHNNYRPVVLRTRAVFCDFTRLRHILHPHLALIAHASSVLC